jgi:hypothetical protein
MAPRAKRLATNGGSFSRADDRFHLTGPSLSLDARIHAYRNDIADIGLAGQIFAPHYARPMLRGCGASPIAILSRPIPDANTVSELLPGEDFAVLEYAGGRAWGYCRVDHITGYVEAIGLTDPAPATHIVVERSAPVMPDADLASPPIAHLPMGSRLHGHDQGAFLATEYGLVPSSHLRGLDDLENDPVVIAERQLGAPFLVGGRGGQGLDATGLIQIALGLTGQSVPRLPDQQRNLGNVIAPGSTLCRGDLVLFESGGGLMVDDLLLIHASSEAGAVIVEPLTSIDAAMEFRRL